MTTSEPLKEKHESSSLALSGMILGIVGLICAFIPAWRTFALIIAIGGVILSSFSFMKSKKAGSRTTRSLSGIICGIIAVCAASYFLFIKPVNMPGHELLPGNTKDSVTAGNNH